MQELITTDEYKNYVSSQNNFVDRLVSYIDDDEIKNMFLSCKNPNLISKISDLHIGDVFLEATSDSVVEIKLSCTYHINQTDLEGNEVLDLVWNGVIQYALTLETDEETREGTLILNYLMSDLHTLELSPWDGESVYQGITPEWNPNDMEYVEEDNYWENNGLSLEKQRQYRLQCKEKNIME